MSTALLVIPVLGIVFVLVGRLFHEQVACNSCLRLTRKRRMTVLADGRFICRECLNITISTATEAAISNLPKPEVRDLARRIVQASFEDVEQLKFKIEAKDERDLTLRSYAVVSEFLYFFMHLVSRFAYQDLGHETRCKIQDQLYPVIITPTIEAIFGHWPEELKNGLEADFIENLGRAEADYARCKQLLNRENPLAEDALLSAFAGNVCRAIGTEKSDKSVYAETFMKSLELANASFSRLDLEKSVCAVARSPQRYAF